MNSCYFVIKIKDKLTWLHSELKVLTFNNLHLVKFCISLIMICHILNPHFRKVVQRKN